MTTIFFVLAVLSLACYIISPIASEIFFRRKERYAPNYFPPVTILKPLKGFTHGSYESFLSYCNLDYPVYQLIFSVQSPDDPVIPTVQKFIARYRSPEREMELVISENRVGFNPKVNNLYNAYQKAKHEIIVYNDSDTRVSSNYLKEIVPPLADPTVGAVTCIPVYRDSKNWVAGLETIGMNADVIPSFVIPALVNYFDFCVGVTIALRKEVLQEIGGFEVIANNICDDGCIGRKIFRRGYRIHLSKMLVTCIHHHSHLRNFYRHMLRWFITIRSFSPFKYLLCLPLFGLSYAVAYATLKPGLFSALFVLALWGGRCAEAFWLNARYIHDKSTTRYFFLLPLHDFLLIPVWIHGWFASTVSWRGRKYRILLGGELKEEIVRASPCERRPCGRRPSG